MTDTRGRPNKECAAQGAANVLTGFFGGMGGCAMIGQSMINVGNGALHRLSGISTALFLLSFILFGSSLIEQIPLAALIGVMLSHFLASLFLPWTPRESLRPILRAVQESTDVPVMVKIAPDLSDADVDAVADLAVELGLAGIVATNTTISREGLNTARAEVEALGAGGISGPPVAERSLEVLRRLNERVGSQLVLISVGGITTPEQAWERIAAGANLLQGYTGLIYGGPDWIRDIHRGIAQQIRAHGLSNISEAVGSNLPWKATN